MVVTTVFLFLVYFVVRPAYNMGVRAVFNLLSSVLSLMSSKFEPNTVIDCLNIAPSQVAGAWSERQKMFHGGSFLKLADDNMDIQNPEAQNREPSGF